MMELFENLAYLMIFGVIAAAFAVAELAELIGFGSHRLVSTVFGSVVGIIILFVTKTAVIPAVIAAAVVSLAASIILDKIW